MMRGNNVFCVLAAAVTFGLAAFCSSYGATPGVLGYDFKSARDLADKQGLPLVVIWGNKGCGYCSQLRSAITTKDSRDWMMSRGYVVVFAENDSAAKSFVGIGGEYPLCRVVWKRKSGNTYEYSKSFNGRLNKMPSKMGSSLSERFRNSVDMTVGGYAKVYMVEGVSESSSRGSVSGSRFAGADETVTLSASAKSGYVLSGWYSTKGVRVSQEPKFGVTAIGQAQSFTAKFILKSDDYASVSCDFADRYVTGVSKVNVPVKVDSGSKVTAIRGSKLPTGLSFDAKTSSIVGTPKKSGLYAVTIQAKTSGGKVGSLTKELIVMGRNEHLLKVECDAGKGRVSGSGVYAFGKKVKLGVKATSGWVFSGWQQGGKVLSQSASYAYEMGDGDAQIEAKFISKSDDRDSIALKLDGQGLDIDRVIPFEVICGVKTNLQVVPFALTLPSVSAAKLPSGLKLVRDKTAGTYVISGVPTKAGGPYQTKLTVKTAAKNAQPYVIELTVRPLPSWAYGDFSGVYGDDHGMRAPVALKISDKGVISGKVRSDAGVTKSFSAKGFDSAEADGSEFKFATSVKSGPAFRFSVGESGVGGEIKLPSGEVCQLSLVQNPWLRRDLAVGLPAFGTGRRQPVLTLDNGLVLKFSAKGVVKASGRVNSVSVSGSMQMELLESGDGETGAFLNGRIPLFLPPKTKFPGIREEILVTVQDSDGDGRLDRVHLTE